MGLTIDSKIIADNIKKIRLENHLTQREMADKLGYDERHIRRIEKEGTSSIDVINIIADSFNVSALNILVKTGMF